MLSARTRRCGLRALSRHTRANVAVEFALVLPVMLTPTIGVFDLSKAMVLNQQVFNSAHTAVLSASIAAVQPDESTSLTVAQVQQSLSAFYAEMPWVRDGIETGTRSVTLSSVTFVPANGCTPSASQVCTMTAQVAWSVAYQLGDGKSALVTRACGALSQKTATAVTAGDLTSIGTAGITNPNPVLIADVHYRYTPKFFKFITGPLDFWSTAYWPVRSSVPGTAVAQQYTKYDIANQANGAGKCAGY